MSTVDSQYTMNLPGLIALFFVVVSADPAGGFFQKGMHRLLGNHLIEFDFNGYSDEFWG